MKTIKELLKYKPNKKFVVFSVVLLVLDLIIIKFAIQHFYGYVFLFSFNYYIIKYMLVIYAE